MCRHSGFSHAEGYLSDREQDAPLPEVREGCHTHAGPVGSAAIVAVVEVVVEVIVDAIPSDCVLHPLSTVLQSFPGRNLSQHPCGVS